MKRSSKVRVKTNTLILSKGVRFLKEANQNNYRFSEVNDLWLLQYRNQVKVNTFTTTKSLLKNHILPIFKDYFLERIDVRMCQEAVNNWYESYSEAALFVSIISRIF